MKSDATLEDYQRREIFLIRYIESQIRKKSEIAEKYDSVVYMDVANAYKDVLYKLTKDDSTANSK